MGRAKLLYLLHFSRSEAIDVACISVARLELGHHVRGVLRSESERLTRSWPGTRQLADANILT